MNSKILKQLVLYRYRYAVGYTLFLLSLVFLLLFELTGIPAGLSRGEIASAAHSAATSVRNPETVINLPYHLLQRASIEVFGLSETSIKLPSVLLAFLTGIGILLLFRRWFKQNIALVAAILATTNSIFLSTGRSGEPVIMTIFIGVYILLFATLVAQEAKGSFVWKLGLVVLAALSLYTPLAIYLLVAALVAGILHPHIRYIIQRFGSVETALGLILFATILAPFALTGWQAPQELLRDAKYLLAVPGQAPDLMTYLRNGWQVVSQAGNFLQPRVGTVVQPAFTIVTIILMIIGFVRTLLDNYAARTYALLIWTAVLIPLIIINPAYFPVLFIPAMLYMAVGLQALIDEWYALFPFNPYARIAAILPLIALLSGLWFLNYSTYFYGNRHSPVVAQAYTNDLGLLKPVLNEKSQYNSRVDIVVPAEQKGFYKFIAADKTNIRVLTPSEALSRHAKYIIVSEDAAVANTSHYGLLEKFIVNDRAKDPLRWRVYQAPTTAVVQ